MNRSRFLIVLLATMAMTPAASAQNNGSVGAFANYFRDRPTLDTNFVGLGGRLSFNVHNNVQVEAELAYDFNRVFTEGFTNPSTGTVTLERSELRVLHALFGPKFQTGGGAIRAFVTLKSGFINFRFDDRPATFRTFTSSVEALRLENVRAVLYPGGGLEFYAAFFGIRIDVGDEIYFRDGARHTLRISLGPHIRF